MSSNQELMLLVGASGIGAGWLAATFLSWIAGRRAAKRGASETAEHRIRSLEADLRVSQRKAEEAELALEQTREQLDAARGELKARETQVAERDRDAQRLRQSLSEECLKTQNLRHELTAKAEETIRASLRVRDAETELSVARAGSEAVMDQVKQLAAEREELTGRLRVLQAELSAASPQSKVTRLPVRDVKER